MKPISVLFAALCLVSSPAGAADDVCVQQGSVDLPFFGVTPMAPAWWDPGLTACEQELGWGASTPIPNGRMVWDVESRTLFFELTVQGDNHEDPGGDIVAVSVTDTTGAPYLYIELDPMSTCAAQECSSPGLEMTPNVWFSQYLPQKSWTTPVWSPRSQDNPTTDVQVVHPWIETTPAGVDFDWTVRFGLQLPVASDTRQLSEDQRIFMSLLHTETGWTSDTVYEDVILCESTSVVSNDCLVFNGVGDWPDLPLDVPAFDIEQMWPRIVSGDVGECPGIPTPEAVCP